MTDEDDLLGVGATLDPRSDDWPWQVYISVAEFVRKEPLESELTKGISRALRAVPGVTAVEHMDREVWIVQGEPSGEELVRACAVVVDALAERVRAFLE